MYRIPMFVVFPIKKKEKKKKKKKEGCALVSFVYYEREKGIPQYHVWRGEYVCRATNLRKLINHLPVCQFSSLCAPAGNCFKMEKRYWNPAQGEGGGGTMQPLGKCGMMLKLGRKVSFNIT